MGRLASMPHKPHSEGAASKGKEPKTADELHRLALEYVEKRHRGPITGAQWMKIAPVDDAIGEGKTWRIDLGLNRDDLADAFRAAERDLTKLYDLA